MKKIALSICLALAASIGLQAQSVCYINTEDILASVPEYQSVQADLNDLAEKYRATIESEYDDINALYKDYQNKKASLSASERQQREDEIITKEKALKTKQNTFFGEDGVMANKSEELLAPIKTKLQNAIDAVAYKNNCSMIIDLAVTTGIVFKNDRYDLTQQTIEYLNRK
ncbi:MAG: OmpH family outer membrane protein [Bacteroidales bacterium]|jgi:outer membrane protein|nr:OmpH family outer membrane protein [Bacteroidales bacterium]